MIFIDKCDCYHTQTKCTFLDPKTVFYCTGKWPKDNGIVKSEEGVCWGTKERDVCFCNGNRKNCTFYPKIRETAESESAYENLDRIAVEESINFNPLEDILTSKYIDPPMRKIVYWFNKCGLITAGHCYGHKSRASAYVSFRKCVTDKMLEDLLKHSWTNYIGGFYKQMWMYTGRNDKKIPYGTIMFMWRWGADTAKDDAIDGMIKLLKKYYKIKYKNEVDTNI